MTHINRSITNSDVIPAVESAVFRDAPGMRFAVGILAVGNSIPLELQREHRATFDLRRMVYVEQTRQLTPNDIGPDGTDRDTDDRRSVVLAVLENLGGQARVVAMMRLIIKGLGTPSWEAAMREPLPVEKEWPEAFGKRPASATALEVSRLISRHESSAVQRINKLQLFAAALAFTRAHNLGPAYAMVEDRLERDLHVLMPGNKRLGDPRYVAHYGDTNVGLELDVPSLERQIDQSILGTMPTRLGQFFYFGKHHDQAQRLAEPKEGIA